MLKEIKNKNAIDQRGVSILQVLVLMAILSGIVVGVTNLLDSQSKFQKNLEFNTLVDQYTETVKNALRDADACTETFQGVSLPPGGRVSVLTVYSGIDQSLAAPVATPVQVPVFSVGDILGRSAITNLKTGRVSVTVNDIALRNDGLATATSVAASGSGLAIIQLVFSKTTGSQTFIGGDKIVRRIPVMISLDSSSNLQKCQVSKDYQAMALCAALGGGYENNPGANFGQCVNVNPLSNWPTTENSITAEGNVWIQEDLVVAPVTYTPTPITLGTSGHIRVAGSMGIGGNAPTAVNNNLLVYQSAAIGSDNPNGAVDSNTLSLSGNLMVGSYSDTNTQTALNGAGITGNFQNKRNISVGGVVAGGVGDINASGTLTARGRLYGLNSLNVGGGNFTVNQNGDVTIQGSSSALPPVVPLNVDLEVNGIIDVSSGQVVLQDPDTSPTKGGFNSATHEPYLDSHAVRVDWVRYHIANTLVSASDNNALANNIAKALDTGKSNAYEKIKEYICSQIQVNNYDEVIPSSTSLLSGSTLADTCDNTAKHTPLQTLYFTPVGGGTGTFVIDKFVPDGTAPNIGTDYGASSVSITTSSTYYGGNNNKKYICIRSTCRTDWPIVNRYTRQVNRSQSPGNNDYVTLCPSDYVVVGMYRQTPDPFYYHSSTTFWGNEKRVYHRKGIDSAGSFTILGNVTGVRCGKIDWMGNL